MALPTARDRAAVAWERPGHRPSGDDRQLQDTVPPLSLCRRRASRSARRRGRKQRHCVSAHQRPRTSILPSPFPWQLLLRASWPLRCRHSPAPRVLNRLMCRCRRSQHTSGWCHDRPCRRGAFPSASERVVMCVRARRPAGCRACIVPCCSSCGTIRARLELPPPSRLVARFLITKRPHPVPEEAFLC